MKRNTIDVVCIECNKTFPARKAEVDRGNAVCCSRNCAARLGNKTRTAKDLNTQCSNCGSGLYRKPSVLIKRTDCFCNLRCQGEWKRKQGWDKARKRPASWNKLANLIKAERGNKCEFCGWNKANCDVAHKIPRKDGGPDTKENALVLCPNHHRQLDEQGKLS